MSEFLSSFPMSLAREVSAASKAPDRIERMADLIEGVARALGFTIAMAADGDRKLIDTFLAGVENYVAEEAAWRASQAELMAQLRQRKAGQ